MRLSNIPLGLALCASLIHAADDYAPGPDSKRQPEVPQGEITKFTFDQSKIFPATTREVSVYVPKQYDDSNPACVFVCQDGVQYQAPVVFDNLIHKKEMPVTVGVFITPGVLKALSTNQGIQFPLVELHTEEYQVEMFGGRRAPKGVGLIPDFLILQDASRAIVWNVQGTYWHTMTG